MPPVTTIPSEETDDIDVPAFKVLNQDNLGPVGMVTGEAIFKPFGRENQKQKPNIVVYPTRRTNGNLEETKQKNFTKSNGYISTQNKTNLKKNSSYSIGNLNQNHCNSAAKKRGELDHKEKEQVLDVNFTKTLDAKLRKLQKEEKSKKIKSPVTVAGKPFITTVKKGSFLDPPPEITTSLLHGKIDEEKEDRKKLYAYASHPRVLNRVSTAGSNSEIHKAKCEAAAIAAAVIASGVAGFQNAHARSKRDINSNISKKGLDGVQLPYSNLMFDRRIVRGNTYAMHPMPTCDGESQASRQAEARRRALARRRAQGQKLQAQRMRLQSPPPVAGRRHERVQTEKHLEEIWERPPEVDNCTQTDLFYDRPVSPYYVPAKTGIDAETQIYPGDLFDFEMEVIPILEVLVGKTVEQALIEVLEEEELAALREQQRRFLEIRSAELAETQRLEEQERRLRAEKDRRIKEHEEGCKTQQETEERIAAAVLIQGYIADLLPSVLEGLNESGFLYDNMKQDIDDNFMPWLMKEVSHEMENMVSSRDVLTDIVKEILENRAEIYRAMHEEHDETSGEGSEETEKTDIAEMHKEKTGKAYSAEHKTEDRATMKETNIQDQSEN